MTKRRSKRESARIAYQDIRRRVQEAERPQNIEEKQTVKSHNQGQSSAALERTRQLRCEHLVLKHFTDCSQPKIKPVTPNPQINATQIAAGLTAITSTVTSLIIQPFNESGKLLTSTMDDMAYNTTLPALLTEQSNNTIFTDYSDVSLSTRLGLAAASLLIGLAIVPIILYAKGYYSCQKGNNVKSENSNSNAEPQNNLDEAEKGLLPTRSRATLKTHAQKKQVSFMLAESAYGKRHPFYKSLAPSNSSSSEKGNDYKPPRSSNS